MSRVLLCWEMGANTGHIRHLSWLAARFSARGHSVAFALKEPEIASACLPGTADIQKAPLLNPDASKTTIRAANYSGLLLRRGYHDTGVLAAAVADWRRVFDRVQPDLVITDHAPTALLATRCASLPSAALGIGFLVPPLSFPMPLFHWWGGPAPARAELRQQDRAVSANISHVLRNHGQPSITQVQEALQADVRALTTVPALDDYAERLSDERYLGTWALPQQGVWPGWPEGEGPRVLGYLRTRYRPFPALIHGLHAAGIRAVVHVPDATPEQCLKWSSSRVQLIREPLDMVQAAAECDIGLGYGSAGFVVDLLKNGKPLLLAPPMVQQEMASRRVTSAGAGLLAGPESDFKQVAGLLYRLTTEDSFTEQAAILAKHIAQWPQGQTMENRIVDACETCLHR